MFQWVYLSDKLCTRSALWWWSHIYWLHIKITSPSLGPDSSLSSSLSVCSSSRQPDSHRSPAQMPWPTLRVCKRVCMNKCVCVCTPPASPQQDCQSVCDYTPTHLRLFCFLTIPPLSLSSFFHLPFAVFNILIKSMKCAFRTGKGGFNCNILHLAFISTTSRRSLILVGCCLCWSGRMGIWDLDEGRTQMWESFPDHSQATPHDVMSARATASPLKAVRPCVCISKAFFVPYCEWSWYFGEVGVDINISLKPLCECCLACLFIQPLPSNPCIRTLMQAGVDSRWRYCLCCCCRVQMDGQDLVRTHARTHTHTHRRIRIRSSSLSLSHSLSVSVMHYRPLSYFADLGLSSGLNLLSTQTRTHARCDHADLLARRTRLDFQYGFVLQHSAPSLRPPSILPPVSVNVIRLVCLLPACCFLCLSVSLSLFLLLSHPSSSLCYCSWGNAMLGFFSVHLCCVLIH